MMITYIIIFLILLALELIYFKVADKFNIIDRPNERSSHSTVVLRGGGIIFAISIIIWYLCFPSQEYLPFLIGLVLIAGVSFWDDVQSLPDSVRLVVQFVAIGLMLWNIGIMQWGLWWLIPLALIVSVGGMNIINFMDGINGITGAYSLAILFPLLLLDVRWKMEDVSGASARFIDESYLVVAIIGVLVFCIFNFRPKGKAKCFAGDVGSIGIAMILLFAIGRLMFAKEDVTYLIFLLIYGVDGVMTIIHRIMLHENLGKAHRKHAFQLMANELRMGHITVSLIYMGLQLAVSLGFIYLCPDNILAHWIYLVVIGGMLTIAYVAFMKKFYPLHEAYLASLEKERKEASHE